MHQPHAVLTLAPVQQRAMKSGRCSLEWLLGLCGQQLHARHVYAVSAAPAHFRTALERILCTATASRSGVGWRQLCALCCAPGSCCCCSHEEFPEDWFEGLHPDLYRAKRYVTDRNKYKVQHCRSHRILCSCLLARGLDHSADSLKGTASMHHTRETSMEQGCGAKQQPRVKQRLGRWR